MPEGDNFSPGRANPIRTTSNSTKAWSQLQASGMDQYPPITASPNNNQDDAGACPRQTVSSCADLSSRTMSIPVERKPAPIANSRNTPDSTSHASEYNKKKKRKRVPWIPLPYYKKQVRDLRVDERVANCVPRNASTVVYIMGRRINLAQFEDGGLAPDPDFYSLARDWVEDSPYWTQKQRRCCNPVPVRPHPDMVEIEEDTYRVSTDIGCLDEDEASKPAVDVAHQNQQQMDILSVLKERPTAEEASLDATDDNEQEMKKSGNDNEKDSPLLEDLISRSKKARASTVKKDPAQEQATILNLMRKGVILSPKTFAKLSFRNYE